MRNVWALLLIVVCTASSRSQDRVSLVLPAGARVVIASMEDGFDEYLKAALAKKKVPLTIVQDKSEAQFEISGHSESQPASTAKKAILLNFHSSEQATVQVTNLESATVVYAYSVNKSSSAHGKQSTAEACAVHIKDKIESGR